VTDTGLAPLVIIVLPLLIFAIVAARQQIRAHRWDPAFFREGIAAYRRGVELPRSLSHVSLPSELEQQLALQMRVRRLSAHELAFFAPVLNGSLMRGLLRYDPEACSLEVVGYLQWGLWALMSTLAFVALPLAAGVAVLTLWAYFGERRRFSTVLREAQAQLR
jgi:hypothetical protein